MEAVQLASNSIDPRIRRTRQMLFDALTRLLTTRDIEHISVADITEQATLKPSDFLRSLFRQVCLAGRLGRGSVPGFT